MNNTQQIFQFIFDSIETPFLDSITQMVAALVNYAAAPIQTALVLYIALTGVMMIRGQANEAVGGLLGRVIKLCIVAWFATNGTLYTTWVQNFFLTALPNDIINAVTAAGNGGTTINANTFDAIWTQSFTAGLQIWKLLDFYDLGEEVVVILFWGVALVSCIVAFAIWFLSHVILGLFIVIGPLLLGLVLFPVTRPIFERWIGAMISCVILQVAVVVMVTLTLQVEGQIIQSVVSNNSNNQYDQLRILLGGVIFFVFSGLIAFQLPAFATSLAGGLHFHTGAISRGLGAGAASLGRTVGAAGKAANATIDSGVAAMRQRIRPPTGGSLSRSSSPPVG